eukprot:275162-Pyramimonas_sp.AAC.1
MPNLLHAQAHILANKVRQQRINNDKLLSKVQEAQAVLATAKLAVEGAENNRKQAQVTLCTLEEQLGALQQRLPAVPVLDDPRQDEVCLAVLGLSTEKLGELVSKAAEGTGIGQEARERLSKGIGGALHEVLFVPQKRTATSDGRQAPPASGEGTPIDAGKSAELGE